MRLIRAEICERNQISQRTLERYLTSYLKGGFDALKPQSRSAECKYKIPQELLDEAIRLRRELPSRSVPTIIKILELEGKAEPGFLKRTTLQDALSRAGYSSAKLTKQMQRIGLVKKKLTTITLGYTSYPICEIDEQTLTKYAA